MNRKKAYRYVEINSIGNPLEIRENTRVDIFPRVRTEADFWPVHGNRSIIGHQDGAIVPECSEWMSTASTY